MPLEIKWYIIQKKQKFVRPKDIIKDVSKIFHRKITYDSIKLLYAKFLRTGSVDDLPRSGRPRALNEREERTLVRNFIAHPGTSIKSIVRNPPPNILRVSRKTISRTLRRRGLIPKTSERGKEIVPEIKKVGSPLQKDINYGPKRTGEELSFRTRQHSIPRGRRPTSDGATLDAPILFPKNQMLVY